MSNWQWATFLTAEMVEVPKRPEQINNRETILFLHQCFCFWRGDYHYNRTVGLQQAVSEFHAVSECFICDARGQAQDDETAFRIEQIWQTLLSINCQRWPIWSNLRTRSLTRKFNPYQK